MQTSLYGSESLTHTQSHTNISMLFWIGVEQVLERNRRRKFEKKEKLIYQKGAVSRSKYAIVWKSNMMLMLQNDRFGLNWIGFCAFTMSSGVAFNVSSHEQRHQ